MCDTKFQSPSINIDSYFQFSFGRMKGVSKGVGMWRYKDLELRIWLKDIGGPKKWLLLELWSLQLHVFRIVMTAVTIFGGKVSQQNLSYKIIKVWYLWNVHCQVKWQRNDSIKCLSSLLQKIKNFNILLIIHLMFKYLHISCIGW